LGFVALSLETCYKTRNRIPYHDHSNLEKPASYRDENGRPDAKFLLVLDPTFQGLENVSVLYKFDSIEVQLLLL
jgi:hypothetical protein